ncbi:MAG TPA: histidine phosphatase family protein [Ktedonobacteraceae bacterium]|nr:histidine phosphatase family protein [Ktedonobacteraceae bacterium]
MTTSKTNTVYLVRHGENVANLTREFSHRLIDYSLTEKGIRQAQQTADFFRAKDIHAIYASPLKRARETAQIIADTLELEVTVLEQFREVNVGTLETLPPTRENWEWHNRIVMEWFLGRPETTFPEGEDYHSLLGRMRQGLQVATQHKTGQNIIIIGHAGIFTITLKDICSNVDYKELIQHRQRNCAITEIELVTNDEEMTGQLKQWASYEHLTEDFPVPVSDNQDAKGIA